MSSDELHVGDVGTTLQFTILDSGAAYDISAFTARYILLKQPGGSVSTFSAVFPSGQSGTAGIVTITTTTGTFDQSGKYQIQGHFTSATIVLHTDVYEFSVSSNLG